ncbi:MAG: arylesterase [Desulfobacterales bacterium]|jgi:lysophospholipase L1-like esterase
MKKILYFILAGLILLAGYRFLTTTHQDFSRNSGAERIIAFGDSLTYGTGASSGGDYPSQLSEMISRPVMNAGVSGDTTAHALKRLERDVLAYSPDIVLITLGGNDLKNGIATDTAFENLKRIVNLIHNQGARVIIGGLNIPFKDRGFGRAYKKLADETGAILIPNILEGIMGNRELMSDPIHPNDAGYKIIAEKYYEAMLP